MFAGRFKKFPNIPAWYLQISYGVWRFQANLEANLRPSQYSNEYEGLPSALHSIIRILPTTYWTWSNADENHIIKQEEKTAYYVVTAEVMTQWFFEILAGWSDNVLPASRTFLPAETAKYHQLSWWTVKAFMVPCFGSNLHMVWVNPRWRYFCSVAYKLTHRWRRRM